MRAAQHSTVVSLSSCPACVLTWHGHVCSSDGVEERLSLHALRLPTSAVHRHERQRNAERQVTPKHINHTHAHTHMSMAAGRETYLQCSCPSVLMCRRAWIEPCGRWLSDTVRHPSRHGERSSRAHGHLRCRRADGASDGLEHGAVGSEGTSRRVMERDGEATNRQRERDATKWSPGLAPSSRPARSIHH